MEKESGRGLFTRLLMMFGGAMAFNYGLLTAFNPSWSYVGCFYFRLDEMFTEYFIVVYRPFFSRFTLGLFLASVGGFLGVVSTLKRNEKFVSLGFFGSLLGFLGFLLFIQSFESPFTADIWVDARAIGVPWVGPCLTLVGVSLMFIGSAAEYKRIQLLSLLGIPPLLVSWLTYPLLILIRNIRFLVSVGRNASANIQIGALAILGFALTISGSAFGIWKSRADLKRIIHSPRNFRN